MNPSNQLVCGPVRVTWNADDSVNTITYQSVPLIEAVNQRLKREGFRALKDDLVENLLNTVSAIPPTNKRQKIYLATKIFEHLRVKPAPPNPKLEVLFWTAIMRQVWAWEDLYEEVHKGTAYYFMASSYLASGDIPSAYICFFNALEDDKQNFPFISENVKDAPAYRTTSLVDNPHNFLYRSVVVPLRARLQSLIDGYNSRTKSKMTIQTLDQKFLQSDPLEDIKRFFVATFHEIYHLAPLNSTRMINNDYSKLKVIDTLFNLGLIVDQILEYRFLQRVSVQKKNMGNAVYQLALNLKWTTRQNSKDTPQFLRKINLDLRSTPDQVLPHLLDGTATYNGAPMDAQMPAILAAYHLRNYGGHHLVGSNILVNRYDDILDKIMDAFFVSIESL